ncbi:MAG TPA: hypothetical protein VNM45_09150 [Bacillus sp. (in: firmicutes)]|nr:hypothetical protein [Bacillus sp. (in: firmicutes)]
MDKLAWRKWKVRVVCWGSLYARYDGTVDVWTDNEEDIHALAVKEARSRLGKDVSVEVLSYTAA